MDIIDIILDKRNKKHLSREQIEYFVRGVTQKSIPDYQISALLMAIVLNGMDTEEMTNLTLLMAESGSTCDLANIGDLIIDKHSTGGVGDKCTPIILPLVASFGVPVVKLSGRGLGFTGGTIDKMESVTGFNTAIPVSDFPAYVNQCHIVLSAQTPELAPADKELYSIRDVTGTVDSIPLIASSIMSKKIAGGANAIVLDITCGDGAFMKEEKDARLLAEAMIGIGRKAKRSVTCVISSMRQPLGFSVGNILEMREVEEFFSGSRSKDLEHVCFVLAASMLQFSSLDKGEELSVWIKRCRNKLKSGEAKEAFLRFIRSQGGRMNRDGSPVYRDTPKAIAEIRSSTSGFVQDVFASEIGKASVRLGAGRMNRSDRIDYGAGILLNRKIGDCVSEGDLLCTLYLGEKSTLGPDRISEATELCRNAYVISTSEVNPPTEVIDILNG
ncbi:MAG: thymidine phosphorylase [Clostridiaceae bacterium]|nr:thymidine phosphorylase [Clostridiaceae bacterium]